jgi:N-acetylneuraminate synthase/sialic acid synthase
MRQLQIGTRTVSDSTPCFVIAEIGGNHGGDVATAVQMIRIASACGVDAVKFQCRDNDTLYSDTLLNAAYENEHSYGKTYGEHRKALELSDPALATCCFEAERSKVLCFSTAFDEPSVDRIVNLGMPAIKIASGGLTDKRLLRHAALTGLPIVLSTGGGTMREIDVAVQLVTCYSHKLALLHCTAAYPVRDFAELNLLCIQTLREAYPETVIGWSGHDSGIAMSMAAYVLGARIIERHFTLNRANKGTDHAFSLEPAGLTKLVRDLSRAHAALGDGQKRYYASEIAPISKMRRRELPDGSLRITGHKDDPSTDPTRPAA